MPRLSKTLQELQDAPLVVEETALKVDVILNANGLFEVYADGVGVFYIRDVAACKFSNKKEPL